MEELINRIVSIDDTGRYMIAKVEDKQNHMEEYIQKEIEKRKQELDEQYKEMASLKEKETDLAIKQKKKETQQQISQEQAKLEEKFGTDLEAFIETTYEQILSKTGQNS